MKKIIIGSLLIFQSLSLISQENTSGFEAPESAITDGKFIYVSNVGIPLDPKAMDNNGYISKLDLDGKMIEEKFIQNLHGPKGMAIIGDILYVTDVNAVLGFDVKSKIKKKNISFEKWDVEFLNDLVKIDDQNLAVSATDRNMIYTISFKKGIKTDVVKLNKNGEKLKGPNGLAYDAIADVMYIVEYGVEKELGGFLNIKDFVKGKDLKAERLFNYKGNLDGLHFKDSVLTFTDWNSTGVEGKSKAPKIGGVFKLDLRTLPNPKIEEIVKPIDGPADFFYDEEKKRIILPAMLENKVKIITVQ
jgi:DNA-binding beta-propeller fold protein YncE